MRIKNRERYTDRLDWFSKRMSVSSDDLDSLHVRKPAVQSSGKRSKGGKTDASIFFVHFIEREPLVIGTRQGEVIWMEGSNGEYIK